MIMDFLTKLSAASIAEQVIAGIAVMIIIAAFGVITAYFRSKKFRNFVLWFRYSYLPISKFNVCISLEANEEKNSGIYNAEIKRNLIETINNLGLKNLIRIRDFKGSKYFKTKEEAEAYSKKNDLDLIVWGRFSSDHLKKDGSQISDMLLNFTFGHPKGRSGRIGQMAKKELGSVFATRQYWQIVEDNSYIDVPIVSSNLTDVCLYTVALSMMLFGEIVESTQIFEKLHQKSLGKTDQFFDGVVHHLKNAYELLGVKEGFSNKNFLKGIDYNHKLLKIDPKNLLALANNAVYHAKLGKTADAERYVQELQRSYPDMPITFVDVAYFRIVNKQYNLALENYKKLSTLSESQLGFNPSDIIVFLEEQHEANLSEYAYLFGSGIMNYYFRDKERGIKLIKEFLKHSNKRSHDKMWRKACKLVRNT